MKISKTVSALRNLIREHIRALSEGGHGGVIYYGLDTRRLFEALAEYSETRKSSPPTLDHMNEFLDKVNKVSRPSKTLSAYSIVNPDKTGPVYKAYSVLEAASNPKTTAEFGPPNVKLIEKQIMKVLGAEFMVKDEPGSGFDMFFGAALDWRGAEDELQGTSKSRVAI